MTRASIRFVSTLAFSTRDAVTASLCRFAPQWSLQVVQSIHLSPFPGHYDDASRKFFGCIRAQCRASHRRGLGRPKLTSSKGILLYFL